LDEGAVVVKWMVEGAVLDERGELLACCKDVVEEWE